MNNIPKNAISNIIVKIIFLLLSSKNFIPYILMYPANKYKNTNQSVRLFENYSDKEFITFFEFITGVLKEMLGE